MGRSAKRSDARAIAQREPQNLLDPRTRIKGKPVFKFPRKKGEKPDFKISAD